MKSTAGYKLFPSLPAAPCRLSCPIDQNVQEYVACIAEGRFQDAINVIRRTNPFPSICGRICPRPCEFECARSDREGPVAIRELKRFTADLELQAIESHFPFFPESRKEKIAVIGAGASGLTAACDLRSLGYPVTAFEAMPFAGGMLALSYPDDILPQEILGKDIGAIRAAGVSIVTGKEAGGDFSIDDLGREGYRAVLIAAGAGKVRVKDELKDAESLPGFHQPAVLLKKRKDKNFSLEGKRVLIEGVTALSVHWAMLAAGDGAGEVTLVSHLPPGCLPVENETLDLARKRGVKLLCLHAATGFDAKGGRLSAVTLGKFRLEGKDIRGRASVTPSPGKPEKKSLDVFIPAGPGIFDPSTLGNEGKLKLNAWGYLAANPETMMVSPEGIFAAGEALSGGRSVVETIASGHRAATNIHKFLSGETVLFGSFNHRETAAITFNDISNLSIQPAHAINRASAPKSEGIRIETKMKAIAEARKCLRCGGCFECDTCHHFCRWNLYGGAHDISYENIVRVDDALLKTGGGKKLACEEMQIAGLKAVIDETLCDGCALCEPACPYDVINTAAQPGSFSPAVAVIDGEMCRACGLCMAVCPPRAITYAGFQTEKIIEMIRRKAPSDVVFRCRWSKGQRGKSDIEVGCLGQVPSGVVMKALEYGCRFVLAVGCDEECHHKSGARQAEDRFQNIKNVLSKIGVNPDRVEVTGAGRAGAALEKLRALPDPHCRGAPSKEGKTDCEPMPEAEIKSAALVFTRSAGPGGQAGEKHFEGTIYFPGCTGIVDELTGGRNMPGAEEILDSSLKLIEASGIGSPRHDYLGCCGLPFLASGETEKFNEVARSNVARLLNMGAHRVVLSCTDCLSCYSGHYGRIENSSRLKFISLITILKEAGAGFAGRKEAAPGKVAFLPSLPDILDAGPAGPAGRMTENVGPVRRTGRETENIIDLLKRIEGVEVVYTGPGEGQPAACAGAGWKMSGREIKRRILEVIAGAVEKGAHKILTSSHHCYFHLQRALIGGSWQTHDIEILPVEVFLKDYIV